MFDDLFAGMFGSTLPTDPTTIKRIQAARQQYGKCVMPKPCTPGGIMCMPCAFVFRAARP